MGIIYNITITGSERTPYETIAFLKEASNFVAIKDLGVDLRYSNYRELKDIYNLNFPEFIAGGKLSNGELGCLLSHQLAYQQMIHQDIDWALIIEDDTKMLIDFAKLHHKMIHWSKQKLEIVHLAPSLGGVVNFKKNRELGKVYVPPLGAYAYWISRSGALKLLTKKNWIGGLADWPIQIAMLDFYGTPRNYAYSSIDNSLIGANKNEVLTSRVNLSYRSIYELLKFNNLRQVIKIADIYGYRTIFKHVILYRFYRRFAKLLSHRSKGDNTSDYLTF